MKRTLFNLATLVSLALLLLTCALWATSYWQTNAIHWLPRHPRQFNAIFDPQASSGDEPSNTAPDSPNASVQWVSVAGRFRLEYDRGDAVPDVYGDLPQGLRLHAFARNDDELLGRIRVEDLRGGTQQSERAGIVYSENELGLYIRLA